MARRKKVSFTLLDEGDCVDKELRRRFYRTAGSFEISRGKLMSRAFYLACLELEGEINMEKILDKMRAYPIDPKRPLDEDVVIDSETWKKQVYDNEQRALQEFMSKNRRKIETPDENAVPEVK